MTDVNTINTETEKFQATVKKLSYEISQAGVNWSDEKHKKLAELVNNIAKKTKSVMSESNNLVSLIKRFNEIDSSN